MNPSGRSPPRKESVGDAHPDMVGPVKGCEWIPESLHVDTSLDGKGESLARWLATVDQPDIRGLVTDMT